MNKWLRACALSLGVLVSQTAFSARPAIPKVIQNEMKQAYEGFQGDADIIRLQHIRYWANLIEEYHAKTGKYPFQGESDEPILVKIATPRQSAYFPDDPRGYQTYPMKKWVATLEKGLGRTIDEHYDPQYAPDAKPNFYVYMINGEDYFLAVHTHQAYPFARKVASDYYKVEVSNRYEPYTPLIFTSAMLFGNRDFKQALNKPMAKPEFFAQRDQESLHITKTKR